MARLRCDQRSSRMAAFIAMMRVARWRVAHARIALQRADMRSGSCGGTHGVLRERLDELKEVGQDAVRILDLRPVTDVVAE